MGEEKFRVNGKLYTTDASGNYIEFFPTVQHIEELPSSITTTATSNPWDGWKSKIRLPDICGVTTYNNRVVKVDFADGTFTKALCSENDTFDLDIGITICLLKKLVGGTKPYNDIIRGVHELIKLQDKLKAMDIEEKRKRREEQKRRERKNQQRRLEEAQQQMDVVKAGVLEALREHSLKTGDDLM